MNDRSERVMEYMRGMGKIDYATFKRMKFDRQLPAHLRLHFGIDTMLTLSPSAYPDIADLVRTFQSWDRKAEVDSKGAAIFLLAYYHVSETMAHEPSRELTLQESVDIFRYVKGYMQQYFGRTDLALGDIQKLVRGDSTRPAAGLPDVLAAAHSEPYKNGLRRVTYGDAYICLVRYPREGLPIIESINTFGASSRPDSPHFRDQETMFQEQRLKHETLDKQEILRTAERVYHPG